MKRREWLLTVVAGLAAPASAAEKTESYEEYFKEVLRGFQNATAKTSASGAVCDFPGGTILDGTVGASHKTYVSVARMLPAIAAYARVEPKMVDLLLAVYRNAFDPSNPDYWQPAPNGKVQQRQVEASLVAWSLWLSADQVLPKLTSRQRHHVQDWLVSCTETPVRKNNWAWFTAVNQAARLALSKKWPEFAGNEASMQEDLKALDALAAPGPDGWYSDAPGAQIYDYYNFWVFASHFLYWNKMVGSRYPGWSQKFAARLKPFLEKTPYFFGSNGSHVLFGRSLIYRWAALTPLVLAYEQKLWPHSPGLLRALVRRNIEYFWKLGAFDTEAGKLRETLTSEGTRAISEPYVDNGHPYWGMQAYALYLIPRTDPFWTEDEAELPVEKASFRIRFDGTQMLLAGEHDSGEVRWVHAVPGHQEPQYRDKYTKFTYSTHAPPCLMTEKGKAAHDSSLVFRNPATGELAGAAGTVRGALTADGYERVWWAQLGETRIDVTTRIKLLPTGEEREHTVKAPAGIEVLDGSVALGLRAGQQYRASSDSGKQLLSNQNGKVVSEMLTGFDKVITEQQRGTNVIYPRVVLNVLHGTTKGGETQFKSRHTAELI